jgi:hypothetical protein
VFRDNESSFSENNRVNERKKVSSLKPFVMDYSNPTSMASLPIYSEDSYTVGPLMGTKNFVSVSNESDVDLSDSSYDSIKLINYLHHSNYLNTVSIYSSYLQPISYTQVLNSFMAGSSESVVSGDSSNIDKYYDDSSAEVTNDIRSSNVLKLRGTAKNAIVTFNALQKVFRPRYDEGRSNARVQDISNSYVNYPFLGGVRTPYESLLGKNRDSFFSAVNYKNTISSNFSDVYSTINSLNIYFSNIPFLLSYQSDASRYI